jgi:NAD(P)-dependent dehydrogenase (short-subunit alcohol dehydrogenase family)
MELKDAVVVLTGASAGIGEATARRLAREGARLVLAARRGDRLGALATELQSTGADVLPVATDMTVPGEVQSLIAQARRRFGRLDVLVNNAAVSACCPVEKMPDDVYRQMFDLNVLGPLHAMQAAVPIMRAQGGGLIVNVSSMVSRVIWPSMGAYASTKFALNCLSETLRVETAKDNIRVSVVFPDNTGTDFGKNSLLMVDPPTAVPNGGEWRVDPPELVAGKIAHAIRTEPDELYVR